MSTLSQPGRKLSTDAPFLECHQLLKSMEEAGAAQVDTGVSSATHNGHYTEDGDQSLTEVKSIVNPPSEIVCSKSVIVTESLSADQTSENGREAEIKGKGDLSKKKPTDKEGDEAVEGNGSTSNGNGTDSVCDNGSNCDVGNGPTKQDGGPDNEGMDDSSQDTLIGDQKVTGVEQQGVVTADNVDKVKKDEVEGVSKETKADVTDAKMLENKTSVETVDSGVKSENAVTKHSAVFNTGAVVNQSVTSSTPPGTSVLKAHAAGTWVPKPIAPKPSPSVEEHPLPVANSTKPALLQKADGKKGNSRSRSRKDSKPEDLTGKKPVKELGPTANFLSELGLDLVKEGVYKDLISIQSRKKKNNKLSESEEKQLEKLRENYDSVCEKNSGVKVSFNMKCDRCKFSTESKNVMWWHLEHPHTDDRENLYCSHCDFITRVPVTFTYHLEAEHGMRGRIIPKPAFWQCGTCQFETNSKGVLTKHKWKCEKAFDLNLNLCPTTSHVSYCLAYNFYKTPKKSGDEIAVKITPPSASKAAVPVKQVLGAPVPRPSVPPSARSAVFNIQQRPTITRPPVRTNPMRMQMVLQNMQRPVVVDRSLRPPLQYIQRAPVNTPLTVKQMLNNPSAAAQMRTQHAPRQPVPTALGLVSCEICKGYVKDKDALRVHFYFAHQIDLPASLLKRAQPPLYCETCYERFWTSQGLQKHKETYKHMTKPPQNNQSSLRLHICIICGIRVTNLLNHMNTVHNLTLKDFLIAKRCIVCGGSFQNRPSLEVHLASSHGILVKTSPAPVQVTPQPASNARLVSPANRAMKLSVLKDGTSLVCVICNIAFLSNELLAKHCQHCHACCVSCGLIFVDITSRNRHKCQAKVRNINDILICRVCKLKIFSGQMKNHVLRNHVKKCSVTLKRVKQAEERAQELVKKRRLSKDSDIIVLDDSDDLPKVSDQKKESSGIVPSTAGPDRVQGSTDETQQVSPNGKDGEKGMSETAKLHTGANSSGQHVVEKNNRVDQKPSEHENPLSTDTDQQILSSEKEPDQSDKPMEIDNPTT